VTERNKRLKRIVEHIGDVTTKLYERHLNWNVVERRKHLATEEQIISRTAIGDVRRASTTTRRRLEVSTPRHVPWSGQDSSAGPLLAWSYLLGPTLAGWSRTVQVSTPLPRQRVNPLQRRQREGNLHNGFLCSL